MYGDCKTAEDVWQPVEVLFLWMKIAKDTFKEIIGIIKLSYHNASRSFIHCIAKNISSVNEQNQKNLFLSQIYQQKHWHNIRVWARSEHHH